MRPARIRPAYPVLLPVVTVAWILVLGGLWIGVVGGVWALLSAEDYRYAARTTPEE